MTRIAGWLIAFTFAACTNHTKVPKDIIAQKKMEKIMWDMVQADRYVSNFIMNRSTDSLDVRKKNAAIFYERVFDLNKISREDFLKSYNFYLGRPDITKKMFDSISARADRQRDQIYRQTPKNTLLTRRDSLLRVDSIRRSDSIEKIDLAKPSTEEMFADSVLAP